MVPRSHPPSAHAFPRGDNHLSLFDPADDASIDAVIERLDASGDTLYHPFLGVENGEVGPDGVS